MKLINDFETCIIFSGDSDFHYLIKELKKHSKMVVVASLKYHVSRELVEASDFYLDLRKVRYLIQREKEKNA